MRFIKDMFSGSGEVSSKRVAGLLALLCAITGIFTALLSQTDFDSLLMYSATLLSASVVTTIFNKK